VPPRIKDWRWFKICCGFPRLFQNVGTQQAAELARFIKTVIHFLGRRWEKDKMIDSGALYALGIALIFVGVLIIVLAVLLLSVLSVKKGKVKGGGAIIIGPISIIFGTDKKSLKTVLLLSLALTVLLIVAMVIYYLLLR
jgi:uncharacterized protein (TIGR00304 family)